MWAQFYEGASYKARGPALYYVDVAARLVGWDIVLRRGGDKQGEPIMYLRKAIRLLSLFGWDKGSKMKVKVSTCLNESKRLAPLYKSFETACACRPS